MRNIVSALIGITLFWSCKGVNEANPLPVPREFSIGGKMLGKSTAFEQTIFDGGDSGSINVFDRADKALLLQSFKNGKDDSDGFWTIRINGIDIENLTLPYTLTGVEGSITWVDESLRSLQGLCSVADVICFYSGVGVDEVTIRITNVENNIISGNFEGRLFHIRLNPSVVRDANDIVDVVNGTFNIMFQSK